MTIRTTSSRVVYRNPWMTVREDAIQRSDGSSGIYGVVSKADFALVIPSERDGFHLVEQYRYPVGGRYWEFPQGNWTGRSDDDLVDPAVLARGELAEETGLRAGTLVRLGYFYEACGHSDQGCDIFLATDLTAGQTSRDPEESDMRTAWFPRDDVEGMILDGQIRDGVSIAALTLLTLHEKNL
jgi:8-oxo-dGTP pyrophosphatase MutT (NUDIX family)